MNKSINAKNDQNTRYAYYKAYAENKFYIFKVYDIIKKLNRKSKFKKTLDVGCADGSFSKKLKEDFGFDTYGIDISEKSVNLANKNGVKAKKHNLENLLPYPDNHFDLIISCEIIEHLYDTDFFIEELKRVLKKGGFMILTTPNLVSFVNRAKILMGLYPSFVPEYHVGGAGHIRAYTLPVLKKQLTDHKMKVVIKSSPNFFFPMQSKKLSFLLKNIAIKLGDYFPSIGSHIIVVAKK
ncbi:MAG: class I SAM-dependent methyltransferase [Nanoarchaeota archaeon]|nr:class I SAM-dependent methyltransferase [Nanoarchaeota archaeon]